METVNIKKILDKHKKVQGNLISILEDIQSTYNYLPEQALRQVAIKTGRSLSDIYGVATFYRAFSLKPRGKHLLSSCLGTACHVRGAINISQRIEKELGIKPGETTTDRQFSFETVNCIGACALGPVVVINKKVYGKMDIKKTSKE